MTVLSDEELKAAYNTASTGHIGSLRAVADAAVDADRAGRGEPVYAFRRRGIDDFCTCTKQRYDELASKPKLFEVAVFYTHPLLDASKAIVPDEVYAELSNLHKKLKQAINPINESAKTIIQKSYETIGNILATQKEPT